MESFPVTDKLEHAAVGWSFKVALWHHKITLRGIFGAMQKYTLILLPQLVIFNNVDTFKKFYPGRQVERHMASHQDS